MENKKFSKFVLLLNQKTNYTFGTWIDPWIRVPKVWFVFWFKNKTNFIVFHFPISKQKLKKERIFWNSFFDFKSKNEFKYFDFCFLQLVLNQDKFKKIFFFGFHFSIQKSNLKNERYFLKFVFSFQIKKTNFKILKFVFRFLIWNESHKVCFDRWVLKWS